MATPSSKVKIDSKTGIIEVEGTETFIKDVLEKYALFVKSEGKKQLEGTKTTPETEAEDEPEKKDGRGGIRSNVISKPIDKLVESDFFNEFKTVDDVVKELKRLAIPGVNGTNVGNALARKIKKKLDRKQNEDKTWCYIKKSI